MKDEGMKTVRATETRGLERVGIMVWASSFILHPSSFQFPLRSLRDGVNMRPSITKKIRLFLNLHNLNNLAGGKNEKP